MVAPDIAQAAGFIAPPGYSRRRPETTLLYRLVAEHYPKFRDRRAAEERSLPRYVEDEFEAYLKCGRLEQSVPHSDQVQVMERWNVIDDGDSLVNELTIIDPVMYAEPIVLRQYYTRAPSGTRMLEYECTEGMWLEHERAREPARNRIRDQGSP